MLHEKELEIFVKSNKSDPKQPSMSTFTIPLVIAEKKQTELEKNHAKIHSELGTIAFVP